MSIKEENDLLLGGNDPESLLKILREAQEEKKNLEQQRLATLNVLEDVHQAQEELAAKYDYIKNIRDLLENLTVSTDFISVAGAAFASFQKMIESSCMAFFYEGNIYVFSKHKLPSDYKEILKKSFLSLIEPLSEEVENKKNFLKLLQQSELKIITEDINKEINQEENFPISFPIIVKNKTSSKEKILGLLYLNCINKKHQVLQDQENIINDIVNLIAINIERIQALDASEHSKFNDLVQSMTDGILMFDTDRKIVLFNPVLQKITGLPNIPTLAEFIQLFKDVDLEPKINESFQKEEVIVIKEVHFLEFDYEISIAPVRDYKKNIMGGTIVFHDITRLKEIDRMKTDFLSVAAHQLRTPLGSIRWNTEMLINGDYGQLSEIVKKTLNQVHNGTLRMINLVNDLIDVSHIDQGNIKTQPEMTNIIKIIKDIIEETAVIAKQKNISVNLTNNEDKIFEIFVDPRHLRLVIENFLSNAINYNKENGSVGISLEREDEQIIITIKDTGIGIPLKDQIKLFSKFFRAGNAVKTKTDGSGLGLFAAKSYIDSWRGKIEFVSKEGEGTTFTIKIPEKIKF